MAEQTASGRAMCKEETARIAELEAEKAIFELALENACADAWTDGEAAMAQYVRRARAQLAPATDENQDGGER